MGLQVVKKTYLTDCTWTAPAGVGSILVTSISNIEGINSVFSQDCRSGVITTTNDAYMWGSNLCGSLGNGSITVACLPTLVCCGLKWKSISSAATVNSHSIAVTLDGNGYAWGIGTFGRLGNGSETEACLPTPVCCNFKWKQVAAGQFHSSGITINGDAYSWGRGLCGGLGVGSVLDKCQPTLVCCGLKWRNISLGDHLSLGVTDTGDGYAWGDNTNGKLGVGSITARCLATPICCNFKWKSLSAGPHSVGITTSGDGYAWGNNDRGQLGIGSDTNKCQPNLICCGLKWKQLVAGEERTFGITCDGDLYAWGHTLCGALGVGGDIGSASSKCLPTRVCCNFKWISVAPGAEHTVGLTTNGQVYSWGNNACGKLGVGSITLQCFPTLVCCGLSPVGVLPPKSKHFTVVPGVTYQITINGNFVAFQYEPLDNFAEGVILEYYNHNNP